MSGVGVPLPVLAVDQYCRGWRQLTYVRVRHVAIGSGCSSRRLAGGLASGLCDAGLGIRWKYVYRPIWAPVGAVGATGACNRDLAPRFLVAFGDVVSGMIAAVVTAAVGAARLRGGVVVSGWFVRWVRCLLPGVVTVDCRR